MEPNYFLRSNLKLASLAAAALVFSLLTVVKVKDLLPTVQHHLQDRDQRLNRRSVQRIPAALVHLTEACWEITELLQHQQITCRDSFIKML